MKHRASLLLPATLALGVLLSRCASYSALAPEERGQVEQELRRSPPRYLRSSMYVTPFFGDGTKKLLTALPPDEVDLVEDPGGRPLSPGAVEQLIPAGTRVRVEQLEFPTAWVVASRILFTPRTQPWVYVRLEGESTEIPFILVLPPFLRSRTGVLAALDPYLLQQSPAARLESYPSLIREAIRQKHAVVDMPTDALEASWGFPERKTISFEGANRLETWVYPGHKRRAYLRDGRVERFEPAS